MDLHSKAPQVYKPIERRFAAPPVYRPAQPGISTAQLKPANQLKLETRPAPPVYQPQQTNTPTQPKTPSPSMQPQVQYELSPPVWVGNGRQQIRVKMKGSPTPVGSVDVHYRQPGTAFISDLEVNQSHRRHGIATMLMKAALESARRNGSNATELEARPSPGSISNQALVGMYEKLGFRNSGVSSRGNPRMSVKGAVQQKPAAEPFGTRMNSAASHQPQYHVQSAGLMSPASTVRVVQFSHPVNILMRSMQRTVQRTSSKDGKMGATYFTQSKDEDDIARRQKAEAELGLTSAHGSTKPGKDSGISNKTLTEEAAIVEHMRKQKEKEYLASRPKAKIHNASPMSPGEKARKKALELIQAAEAKHGKGTTAMAEAQEEFEAYLERREVTIPESELDKIYELFV